MRIITGTLKGRRLKAPDWPGLRPTSDKLRETLFNVLGARVTGATFVDGYAGTGAVGIEALSRGAGFVTFVEEDPRAWMGHAGAGAGLLLFGVVAFGRGLRGWQWLLAASMGATVGAVMIAQWKYMVVWNRYPTEWGVTGLYSIFALAFAVLAVRAIRRQATGGLGSTVSPLAAAPGLVTPAAARRAPGPLG